MAAVLHARVFHVERESSSRGARNLMPAVLQRGAGPWSVRFKSTTAWWRREQLMWRESCSTWNAKAAERWWLSAGAVFRVERRGR